MGLLVVLSVFVLMGIMASVSVAFADETSKNSNNPLGFVFNFIQDFKFGQDSPNVSSTVSDEISVTKISDLQKEISILSMKIKDLENPSRIYTTELEPITDIDCSKRNQAQAFLSGWCPHPERNVYFIEDTRVNKDSLIAITLLDENRNLDNQNICGVINQDALNFSFHEPDTGKITTLNDLKGFLMKCDKIPLHAESILKYTIINS